jgi:single-strand DNA-binding protein
MSAAEVDDGPTNQVYLRGRLAAEPVLRELPSGDVLAIFRLTVDRPPGDRVRVDSIECTSVAARVPRSLARAVPGEQVEVTGSLHRRFWRSPAGPASRYTVDAATVKVSRTGRRGAASPSRKQASG